MAVPDQDDDLPGVLGEFAAVAGRAAALRLAADFGGTEVYVPREVDAGHPLAKSLGLAAARKLVECFGHGRLLVPLGPFATGARRRQAIVRMLAERRPAREIARRLGCHIRTVYYVKDEIETRARAGCFDGRAGLVL